MHSHANVLLYPPLLIQAFEYGPELHGAEILPVIQNQQRVSLPLAEITGRQVDIHPELSL
jgi:hypothetical protein